MSKIRCLINYIHYPVAIARYFHEALLQRDDCEVLSAGPYTGVNIPWAGGMQLPVSYLRPPDIEIPSTYIGKTNTPPLPILIELQRRGFDPDILCGIFFIGPD